MPHLGFIPARGGSKGIPGKNIAKVCGKPLIQWTIEAALGSGVIDRLIVSTDHPDIAQVARECGAEVPFMRPDALAQDDTATAPVVEHAVKSLAFQGTVVLLQPTSPLRLPMDIARCTELHRRHGKTVVSITETKLHPSWMFGLADGDRIVVNSPVAPQRQSQQPRYIPNGAVYVFDANAGLELANSIGYIMPAIRSVDIDTPLDLMFAEFLLGRRPAMLSETDLQAFADSFV